MANNTGFIKPTYTNYHINVCSEDIPPPAICVVPGTPQEKVAFVKASIQKATIAAQTVLEAVAAGPLASTSPETLAAAKIAWGNGKSDESVRKALELMSTLPHESKTADAVKEAWGCNIEGLPMGGTIILAQFKESYGLPLIFDDTTGLFSLSPTAEAAVKFQVEQYLKSKEPLVLKLPAWAVDRSQPRPKKGSV